MPDYDMWTYNGSTRFNILSYMKTSLSPFRLNEDAMKLIKRLEKRFNRGIEEKAQILLNGASFHPKMSKYQLSLTHKAFGDVYYTKDVFGGAGIHYCIGIELNQHLAVKRKIKEINAMPEEKMIFSCSPDIVANVLEFKEYSKYSKELEDQIRRRDSSHAHFERRDYIDSIIDSFFEAEIDKRLEKLGETYKSEFYRIQELRQLTRKIDDPLSLFEYKLMDLAAMERSASFAND